MEIFEIQGSGENKYKVSISEGDNKSLIIFCDCKAGIYHKMCKHKLAVATGDPSLLLKQDDTERLKKVSKLIAEREIGQLLQDLYVLRKEHDAVKRKMDKARKAVELAMKG